jgi:hypothetical protein
MRHAVITLAMVMGWSAVGLGQEEAPDLASYMIASLNKTDLKLTPEQREEIRPVMATLKKQMDKRFKEWNELREKTGENIAGAPMTEPLREADLKLAKILTKAQQKRIAEIRLQGFGSAALLMPRYTKALNIDPDTARMFRQINEDKNAGIAALGQERMAVEKDPGRSRQEKMRLSREFIAKEKEISRGAEAEILRHLTKKQRKQFEAMKGKPHEFGVFDEETRKYMAELKAAEKVKAEKSNEASPPEPAAKK